MKKRLFVAWVSFVLLLTSIPLGAWAIPVGEGKTVDTGNNLASFTVPAGLEYYNKMDTLDIIRRIGDIPSNLEIGSVGPLDENQSWLVYFEYEETGHIKDEDQNDIDADEILDSYKEGTEEANKKKTPENQLHVIGWDVEPTYDAATRTLQWSMKLEDSQKQPIINYKVEKLTRRGVISFILATDPAELNQGKKILFDQIMPNLNLKEGSRYEDFIASTDKVADYGLSGLILGGLGVVAAKKLGLLALLAVGLKKFGIVIVLAIGVLFGWIKKKLSRKKEIQPGLGHGYVPPQQPGQPYQNQWDNQNHPPKNPM